MFSKNDEKFMKLALKEAKNVYRQGEYPVVAILVIDGKIIDIKSNSLVSSKEGITHAEMNVIRENSLNIIKSKKENKNITLYTTLEPCLMCLGTSVLHNISRIVYASSDPDGGALNLIKTKKKGFYSRKWPVIEGGLYEQESRKLLIRFLEKQTSEGWKKVLKNFKNDEKTF